jgi:C-terminal processing protease CtpA/Prc
MAQSIENTFQALQEVFPEIDRSGINVSRVCYESYDTEIYINEKAEVFKKTKKTEKVVAYEKNEDEQKVFKNILTWLSNKNEAFVTGERNNFIFKLASACCRFGINEMTANSMIHSEFLTNSEFTKSEADRAIRSAYKANSGNFGSASFDKEILVDKVSRKELIVEKAVFDEGLKLKDVIYGIDVKQQALDIFENGYKEVNGVGVQELMKDLSQKRRNYCTYRNRKLW